MNDSNLSPTQQSAQNDQTQERDSQQAEFPLPAIAQSAAYRAENAEMFETLQDPETKHWEKYAIKQTMEFDDRNAKRSYAEKEVLRKNGADSVYSYPCDL